MSDASNKANGLLGISLLVQVGLLFINHFRMYLLGNCLGNQVMARKELIFHLFYKLIMKFIMKYSVNFMI